MSEPSLHSKVAVAEREVASGRTAARVLTGDETVDEIVAQHPGLRSTLMAFGLCTCCSGGLTLRQNAEAHGVPLRTILADLEDELAKGA